MKNNCLTNILTSPAILSTLLCLILLIALLNAPAIYANATSCEGKYKDGGKPTEGELAKIYANHRDWYETYGPGPVALRSSEAKTDPRRANLCGAIVPYTVDLSKAHLPGANLSEANLGGVNLSGAFLLAADLSEIFAPNVDLSSAHLGGANLRGARLEGAKLDETNLAYADLRGALLWGASLHRANLAYANLAGAIYEAESGSLPRLHLVAEAKNLSQMIFDRSPLALTELREAFKNAGLRSQERQITYAIKHAERLKAWQAGIAGKIESAFNYIFFELTTDWGMFPAHALMILGLLIVVFAFPYAAALRIEGEDGIWRVWVETRLRKELGQNDPEQLQAGWLKALRLGFYFSLLSAFHIGWRDFNVGNWLARLQAREYTLRATGWVRTISGIQSLISVYLLAVPSAPGAAGV